MEQTQRIARQNTLDRLELQRQSLSRHMQDLENQLKATGNHIMAVDEHIQRLRNSIGKTFTKH